MKSISTLIVALFGLFLTLVFFGITLMTSNASVYPPIEIPHIEKIEIPEIIQPTFRNEENLLKEMKFQFEQGRGENIELVELDWIATSIKKYADLYNIPYNEAFALVNQESHFFSRATSRTGCRGLCQVSWKGNASTLKEYNNKKGFKFSEEDLYSIDTNLKIGLWYFARLKNEYGKTYNIITWEDAYTAFNVGPLEYNKNWRYYDAGRFPPKSASGNKGIYRPRKSYIAKSRNWENIFS